MSIVDLSTLPAPQVLESLDFEEVYQADLATFRLYMGENWSAQLESDPVLKLLEVGAYRKVGNRARVNDAARSLLLAHAKSGDLDQLAANVRLQRLVVQAEDLAAVPPVERVLEEDDALRERIQLVYEGLTTAGPRSSYILWITWRCGSSNGRKSSTSAKRNGLGRSSPAVSQQCQKITVIRSSWRSPYELRLCSA